MAESGRESGRERGRERREDHRKRNKADRTSWFAVRVLLGRNILELEADGELEIELNGGTLVWAAQGVQNLDVDLGSIKCTVTWI